MFKQESPQIPAYFQKSLNHSLVICCWNSITAAIVVAIGAVAVTVSSVIVDAISLVVIASKFQNAEILLLLLFKFSAYVVSISPSQRDLWLSFKFLLIP